jgi:O-antigen ligase
VLAPEDVLLLGVVVGLPWFWGGVGLDAYRAASAVVAVAAGWALVRHGAPGLGLGRGSSWLLPAFLLGAWAFAQTIPLPRTMVATISPKAAAVQAEAFGPAGRDANAWLRQIEHDARARVPEANGAVSTGVDAFTLGADAPSPPRAFTLSLQPAVTLERAFWYAALLLAFLLAHARTGDKRRAAIYRVVLFTYFGVLAVVGIIAHASAPTRLLWLRDSPVGTRPFGPFVNPSHFAGVLELAVPWLLGYGLTAVLHTGEQNSRRTLRVLALIAAGFGASSAVLAASKMAVMTIGLACGVLIAVAIAKSRGRGRVFLLAGATAAALLLCAFAVFGPLRGRVAEFAAARDAGVSPNYRALAWSAGLQTAADYRWSGIGFGALGEILHAYLPRGEGGHWAQLHNDYLEVYVAGGLVAAALLLWLAMTFGRRAWLVIRSEPASGRLLSTLGLACGLVALAVHEFVDFNLQIPANALLFVVMAAMCVSPLTRDPGAP